MTRKSDTAQVQHEAMVRASTSDTAQAPTPEPIPESADASMMSAHSALVERVTGLEAHLDTVIGLLESMAGGGASIADMMGVPAPKSKPAPANGKTEPVKSKAAAKRARVEVKASNSAKYTCTCGGWGVQDSFKTKHEAKGHTLTQLR